MTNEGNQPKEEIKIRMGRVDSVDVFQVKESELDTLEQGELADIFLNFSIFLFSLVFSILLTLISATFKKPIYEILALTILVFAFILGLLLIFLWYKKRTGVKSIIKRIRNRIPPDAVIVGSESLTPTTTTASEETIPSAKI